MNENFINVWVLNSQLERSPYTQTAIALRRKYGFKPFDKTRPLAQAIMKGWKKHSPADSLVISLDLELMGRLPVNERHAPYNGAKGYRLFLQESLDRKLPGLREDIPIHWDTLLETAVESGAMVDDGLRVVLTDEHSEQEVLSVLRTSETDAQNYTIVEIDATAFTDGGVLVIDVWVGEAEVSGSFDLFAGDDTELVPANALVSATDIPTNQREVVEYPFEQGQVFKLGAIGNSSENGKINGFLAKISVEPAEEKVPPADLGQSAEEVMNTFVEAFKNLDAETMDSVLTKDARETFEINFAEDAPEHMRAQISQMLSSMEVLSSEYVGDEFHFVLKVPIAQPPEASVKMRKVEGIWRIYDMTPSDSD